MGRVEPVAQLLEPFGGMSLSAPVEPDEDQRQDRQTLLGDLHAETEDGHGIHKSTEHLKINIVHANGLEQIPHRRVAPEEIEHQDHQNTDSIIIRINNF